MHSYITHLLKPTEPCYSLVPLCASLPKFDTKLIVKLHQLYLLNLLLDVVAAVAKAQVYLMNKILGSVGSNPVGTKNIFIFLGKKFFYFFFLCFVICIAFVVLFYPT